MPFEIAFGSDVLRITLRGAFTGRDLLELSDAVQKLDNTLAFSPNRITDLTEATGPSITHTDIANAVQRVKVVRYSNKHKCALLAPGLVQYGFARMYQMLSDHPQVTIGVFRDEDAAQVWLTSKEEELVSTAGLP